MKSRFYLFSTFYRKLEKKSTEEMLRHWGKWANEQFKSIYHAEHALMIAESRRFYLWIDKCLSGNSIEIKIKVNGKSSTETPRWTKVISCLSFVSWSMLRPDLSVRKLTRLLWWQSTGSMLDINFQFECLVVRHWNCRLLNCYQSFPLLFYLFVMHCSTLINSLRTN